MSSRAKLRGKPLDWDCMGANKTTHKYGMEDDRVYCYGVYEHMSCWKIRGRCKECGAFIDNAKPLKRRCGMKDKFIVTVTCLGQPFYKKRKTLLGAIKCFTTEYLKKNKYGTMNFTLEVGTYTANKVWSEEDEKGDSE